jgi:hypothetical protein
MHPKESTQSERPFLPNFWQVSDLKGSFDAKGALMDI